MTTYHFTVFFAGRIRKSEAPEVFERLFEAGCTDATPSVFCQLLKVRFAREAKSLGAAIGSAVDDIDRAGLDQWQGQRQRVASVEIDR